MKDETRVKIYEKTLKATQGQPRIIQIAKCFAAFLNEKEINVSRNDILAGNAHYCNFTCSSPAGFRDEIIKYTEKAGEDDPRLYDFEAGLKVGLYQRGQAGHVIAGYDYVLEAGIDALIEVARQHELVSELAVASGIVCRALSEYIKRYADKARLLNLNELADICEKVAHKPPESFREAVQLLWFLHEAIIFEQLCGSMSLGRLDLLLIDFYQNDFKNGKIDRDEAYCIIEAFFKKLGGLRRGYQNVTLGGGDCDGNFIDNEITRICLEASKNLMIDQPLLSMRYTPDMSDSLWEEVLSLMQTGIGFPAMFNDTIAIQSKTRSGISEADAQNYGVVGCVEVSVPGKEYAHTEGLRVNWAKVLELMLNGGQCQFGGYNFGLSKNIKLDSVGSFDEFYSWYKSELLHFLTLAMDVTNALDISYGNNWPTPFMSSLMRGCVP